MARESVVLTHLGLSVPPYLRDCVHQLRLWSPTIAIYLILWRDHESGEFWTKLVSDYKVKIVYTDTLNPTAHHRRFLEYYAANPSDAEFRQSYWIHVKERFFFLEELMIQEGLAQCIAMEYDVLVYMSLEELFAKLKRSHQTLRMVRDNDERGHPGFMYIPTADSISEFNVYVTSVLKTKRTDMQCLADYADSEPDAVHYLPVITEARNRGVPERVSKTGHTSDSPFYLSEDSEYFEVLFDSLVVGQWLGGIDLRNTGGQKISKFENESALYSLSELGLTWERSVLWRPILDGRPLATIHVHCKALRCFLSDRPDYPSDDYDPIEISSGLLKN
jgi:hypothetical protein